MPPASATPGNKHPMEPRVETPRWESNHHVAALDGVRGVAILLVLFHHVLGVGPQAGFGQAVWARLASVGWVGVDLFFALSGFLITGILLETRGRPGYLKNFFARRLLRIVPLYYAFLLLVLGVFPHLFFRHPEWAANFQREQGWYWSYLVNWAMPFRFPDWPPYSLVHLWSLCVEQHFYLLWPLLFLMLRPRGLSAVCLAILCLSPLVRALLLAHDQSIDWALASGRSRLNLANYVFTPLRLDAIAMGSLCRILLSQGRVRYLPRLWAGAMGALGVVFLAQKATLPGTAAINQIVSFSLVAVVMAGLVSQVAVGAPEQRWLCVFRWGWLRALGKYSYSIYIFHLPLQLYLLEYVYPWATPGLGLHTAWGRWLHFGSVLGGSWLVALVTWHLLEQPLLSLKRYFR